MRIFYCSSDLELIEIGIQTRGYEDLVKKSNLLINIGFIRKLTDSSTTKYKLNIDRITSGINSKGVRMIKPMAIDPEKLNGLYWNVSKNLRGKSILIPKKI